MKLFEDGMVTYSWVGKEPDWYAVLPLSVRSGGVVCVSAVNYRHLG